ncbi:hypothetical protein HF888_11480 [Bermanella marisrubri]|uniref:DUF6160 domain-containing protein n=1 Tax=Bermanella marisrubri TaxID=207949 RepID=Q1N152_9GAMM|nr:DUF6160 family protein [Bermanella marisrubri]EAT11999.1 hypothetical protein RED65_11680 [Oceanobacter sp. RED65] [Bermanella marisrubri]QIZ84803.1 hypothetical protein HF888_11480 [Bermanella marisrubri]
MKGLKKLALATAVAAAPFAQAEMTALDDSALGQMTGQAGITIDVDLQMTIDAIKYVDNDGNVKLREAQGGAGTGSYDAAGNNVGAGNGDYDIYGTQGAITMKGLTMNNDGGTATIRGVTIDADGQDGLVIGLNQIGDTAGNGIDITVDAIMINAGNANLAMQQAGITQAPVVAATGAFASNTTVQGDLATFFGDPAKGNWTELTDAEKAAFAQAVSDNPASVDAQTATLLADLQTARANYAGQAIAVGAGDGNVGGFVIEDFRNYIQDDLVNKYNGVFDMALQDSTGAITGDVAAGGSAGRFVRGEIVINGTGNSVLGTGGLNISGEFGGAMDKIAWVDGYGANVDGSSDGLNDAGEFGVKDFGMFHGIDTTGDGISDTIEGMHFTVNIDVVDHESWNNATPGSSDVAALRIADMSFEGTIMMGDIYLGSSTATTADQSLGSVLVKDIDMTGTSVYVYGH